MLAAVLALGCLAFGASCASAETSLTSGPLARLSAAFRPDRLGAHTTVSFAVAVDPPGIGDPSALSSVEVGYPSDLGLATSGLGLQACAPATLEALGAGACPPDSKVGAGTALVLVPFGPDTVRENVTLGIFAAPSSDGYLHLAILATGREPVEAEVVLSGVVLAGRIRITIPPIPSVPGAPYVAIARMSAHLGGGLTYYERVRGRMVAYHPAGVQLPGRCPRGGWPMAALLRFADGGQSRAVTAVRCPRR